VISSNTSSLPEVGADAALYFSPGDIEILAAHMHRISKDTDLANELKENGLKRARLFTPQQHAQSVMDVYKSIIKE
jgi:glycosyltransferase involved in cell wall biosynthesis